MKTEVFYFTGTGNSLVVAKELAANLEAELVSIPSVMKNEKISTDADVLVFVFPVYVGGFPLIIEKFIRKFESLSGKSIYAIANNASHIGGTINILENLIKDKGGILLSGFDVKMPGNYIPMYGAISQEKQNKMFDEGIKKIKYISEHIKWGQKSIMEKDNPILNFFFTLAYKVCIHQFSKMDKNYWADQKCNNCGICVQICPVENIELQDGKPVWLGHCEQCMACLQWCPQQAIQYKKISISRKRYQNPNISVSDMIKQTGK